MTCKELRPRGACYRRALAIQMDDLSLINLAHLYHSKGDKARADRCIDGLGYPGKSPA